MVLVVVGGVWGDLETTFKTFSRDRLAHVGSEPSDVWRAYIPAHHPVTEQEGISFEEAVRGIALVYGFDVSSKSTSGIYTGVHAPTNVFTRTSGNQHNVFTQPGGS